MSNNHLNSTFRKSQEYQSAIMRILGWVVMVSLVGIAGVNGFYDFTWQMFATLFLLHLAWFVGILLHVAWKPELRPWRTYLGALADASGTGCSIYLSGDPLSPFYLIYVWSFLSQGTRFGRNNLAAASISSILSFTVVATLLGGWSTRPVELSFMLFALFILPLYQYSLLNKLHASKQAAEASRRAAEDANYARGNFLATITHELRTPLSGVIGMAGLLNGTRLNEEQKEYLESINASANVLRSLIGDILDLSKIDAGKLELKPVHFDVRNALVEVAGALSSQALDKHVEVVCSADANVPEKVLGDDLRFRQILFNLLGNAVKFTEHGEVSAHISVGAPDDNLSVPHLHISIDDTGIGISKHKLSEIFDSFWQADSSTTRRYGGTGLGTSIARDLTLLMGGVIGVESEEGQGSTFWLKLPLIDPEVGQTPQAPKLLSGRQAVVLETNATSAKTIEDACVAAGMHCYSVTRIEDLNELGKLNASVDVLLVSDSPRGMDLQGLATMMRNLLRADLPVVYLHYPRRTFHLLETNATSITKPFNMTNLWRCMISVLEPDALDPDSGPAVDPSSGLAHGTRVLVAEDDTINAKLIRSLLDKGGYKVTLVRDGEAALREALSGSFDLALIDLRMPKMDGLDFVRAYRQQEAPEERLPIVALTANSAEEARSECLAAGMDEFLTKPVDPQALNELIREFGIT